MYKHEFVRAAVPNLGAGRTMLVGEWSQWKPPLLLTHFLIEKLLVFVTHQLKYDVSMLVRVLIPWLTRQPSFAVVGAVLT